MSLFLVKTVRDVPSHAAYTENILTTYMVRSFAPDIRNIPPCTTCNAIDHGVKIHRYFFKRPCRCCGAKDHSMFGISQDENGIITTINTCLVTEIAEEKTIGEQIKYNFVRYRADEHKFALQYGYNLDEIKEALESFSIHGNGSHMTPQQLDEYKEHVIRICENERASWTFKGICVPADFEEEDDLNICC